MNNLKVKPLTKEQLVISIDRLTRFKYTEDKYLRVFFDIITGNLIAPKLKKTNLEELDYSEITTIAEYIINLSLENLGYSTKKNLSINKKIRDYEKSIFKIDKNVEKLLKNKINYAAFLPLIEDNAPKNLKWLKVLATDKDIENERYYNSLRFPIKKIIITEGATEEILVPEFAKRCGYDFDKEGIFLLSAGGKNQVVKLYYKFADLLKIPIFVLLDKDARANLDEIKPKLRKSDKIHILACGEFEDLLPLELLKRTLNYELENISIIENEMLETDGPKVKILEEVFRTRGRHEFKKVEFAQMVKENIKNDNDISKEIREIIEEISSEPEN